MHGPRGGSLGLRTRALLVALAALAGLLVPGAATPVGASGASAAAPAGGEASISDRSPQPGQSVTVRASGLLPGTVSVINYLPEGPPLATVTVHADGTIEQRVTIPPNTYDGPKQIVVISRDADGRYAYLPCELTIAGPPATAALSHDLLTPNQPLQITGRRFAAGTDVAVVLYPEGAVLAQITAGSDGAFTANTKMPALLLNGKHGFLVAGKSAGGTFAVIKLYGTVTGGVGSVPADASLDGPIDPALLPTTTSTVETTTTRAPRAATPTRDDDDPTGWILAIGAVLLVLIAAIVGWLQTASGRRRWLLLRPGRGRRSDPAPAAPAEIDPEAGIAPLPPPAPGGLLGSDLPHDDGS